MLPDQRKIIKKAKFTDSQLDKNSEKQTKTIEEQGRYKSKRKMIIKMTIEIFMKKYLIK